MSKNPAFQFYPSDWSRDLEEHPLEIEGAWIRIICKLWWSDTRGRLTRTMEQWSRILRVPVQRCSNILNYIKTEKIGEIEGDLTRGDAAVTITSRRMVRDENSRELHKIRQKRYRNKGKCDADMTPSLCQRDAPSSILHTSFLQKEKEKEKEKQLATLAVRSFDPFFEIFWKEYPERNGQKRGKQKAFKEWKALNPDQELREKIFSALKIQKQNYIDCKKHGEFVPEFQDPERWLRNRRWEDEVKIKTWQERLKEVAE